MFNEPTSETVFFNQSSCFDAALGMTKFVTPNAMVLVTSLCS